MRVNDLTQPIQKIVSVLLAALMVLCLAPEALLLHSAGESVQSLLVTASDGTEPFDANDNPGYDSGNSNGIVRSYDSITYSLRPGFSQLDESEYILNIKVTLPPEIRDKAEWDTTSLGWALSKEVDGDNTLTARVKIQSEGTGVDNYSMKLNILGAKNGTKVQPEFSVWLNENEEGGKTVSPNEITVSARRAYNVMVNSYDGSEGVYTVTHNGKRVRVYSVGYVVEMMNDKSERGKLGLEFPEGEEISFELSAHIDDAILMDGSPCTSLKPYLFNYGYNGSSTGMMTENNLFGFLNHWYIPYSNYDLVGSGRDPAVCSVYDSGTIFAEEISTEEVNTCRVKVTVKDFQENGIFPTRPAPNTSDRFSQEVACFAAGVVYFAIPIDDVTLKMDAKFVAEDSELAVGNYENVSQVKKTDDRASLPFVADRPGTFTKFITLCDQNSASNSSNTLSVTGNYRGGDNAAMPGQEFYAWPGWTQSGYDDQNQIKSTDVLLVFDGDAFEPVEPVPGKTVLKVMNRAGVPGYQLYYVTKKDGRNWTSHEEMKRASAENLGTVLSGYNYYSSYEAWKASGETCIGLLVKAKTTKSPSNDNIMGRFGHRLKVKNDAQISRVYPFYNTVWVWREEDGNGELTEDPTADGAVCDINAENGPYRVLGTGNTTYKPVEYDESGAIISGTHNSYTNGQSLLIIGGQASIRKETLQKGDDGQPQNIFTLSGSGNEIAWGLYPSFIVPGTAETGITTTITIEDTLPEGLTYISGSAVQGAAYDDSTNGFVGGTSLEPTVSGQTLKWTMEIHVGDEIPSIFYRTEIDASVENGTQLKNTAVISCELDSREVSVRTGSFTVTVASTLAYRLVKSVAESHSPFDRDLIYDLTIANGSNEYLQGIQVVDILPFNGDPRGSDFEGSYQLKSMKLIEGNGGCPMFVSTSESIRDNDNLPTNDFNTAVWSYWNPNNAQPLDRVTAIGFMPTVGPNDSMKIQVVLTPSENAAGDVYGNRPYLVVKNGGEDSALVLTGNTVKTEIYSSSLEGRIWTDANGNGIQDAGEAGVPGIQVNLLSASGAVVTDTNNNPVSTTTGPDGKYRFDRLYSGSYKVSAAVDLEEYEISPKSADGSTGENDSDAEEEAGSAVINQIMVGDYKTTGKLLTVKNHQDIGLIPPEEPEPEVTTTPPETVPEPDVTTTPPETTSEPDVTTTPPETTPEPEITTTPPETTPEPEITTPEKPFSIITRGTDPLPGYGVIISTARPGTPPTETLDLGAGISDASKKSDRQEENIIYFILIAAAFASVIGAVLVKKKSKR